MDDINFCPSCGKNLPPGTAFCPACGRNMNPNDPAGINREQAASDYRAAARARMAGMLLMVTAALLFFFGFAYITSAGMVDDMFNMYPMLADYYTPEQLEDLIWSFGVVTMIGAIAALTAAILAFIRKIWILAVLLGFAALFIGLLSLVGIITSIVALWMLFKAKPAFRT